MRLAQYSETYHCTIGSHTEADGLDEIAEEDRKRLASASAGRRGATTRDTTTAGAGGTRQARGHVLLGV